MSFRALAESSSQCNGRAPLQSKFQKGRDKLISHSFWGSSAPFSCFLSTRMRICLDTRRGTPVLEAFWVLFRPSPGSRLRQIIATSAELKSIQTERKFRQVCFSSTKMGAFVS